MTINGIRLLKLLPNTRLLYDLFLKNKVETVSNYEGDSCAAWMPRLESNAMYLSPQNFSNYTRHELKKVENRSSRDDKRLSFADCQSNSDSEDRKHVEGWKAPPWRSAQGGPRKWKSIRQHGNSFRRPSVIDCRLSNGPCDSSASSRFSRPFLTHYRRL